jgi:hypothetical protein
MQINFENTTKNYTVIKKDNVSRTPYKNIKKQQYCQISFQKKGNLFKGAIKSFQKYIESFKEPTVFNNDFFKIVASDGGFLGNSKVRLSFKPQFWKQLVEDPDVKKMVKDIKTSGNFDPLDLP